MLSAFTVTEPILTLRKLSEGVKLKNLVSRLEKKDGDNRVHSTQVRVAIGPEHFSLSSWHRCSDVIGCCRYALTLDESTPGCK